MQVEGCTADLGALRPYFQRQHICGALVLFSGAAGGSGQRVPCPADKWPLRGRRNTHFAPLPPGGETLLSGPPIHHCLVS